MPDTPSIAAAAEPFVLPLHALTVASVPFVGGKAANLGELLRAGLPTPDGYCITTAAYARVAAAAGIDSLLADLAAIPANEDARLRQAAAEITTRVRAAPVPAPIEEAIHSVAAALGAETPVAVRSSATAEDLPFASFAGQQETLLNVVGFAQLLAAVRQCWSSLWTERAVTYRARNDIDQRAVQLAVIVQPMVDAEVAGILFTADPISGHRERMVVDASFGLGEAVVSGAVNPDHFVLDAATGDVLERRLGDKSVAIIAAAQGGTRRVEESITDGRSALTDDQLRELTVLGRRAQGHFGAPQDIEFAIDRAETIWLVQSRPITTLFPLPDGAPRDPRDLRVYFSVNVAQGVFRPFTPMGRQAFRLAASSIAAAIGSPPRDPLAGPPMLVEAAGRLFVDITAALRTEIGRRLLTAIFARMEARSSEGLRVLSADHRLSARPVSAHQLLRRAALVVRRTRLPLRVALALVNPAAARDSLTRLEEELRRQDALHADARIDERLAAVEGDLLTWPPRIMSAAIPVLIAALGSFAIAERLLGDLPSPEERDAVRRAVPHNPTTEMDLALWDLARRLMEHERSLAPGDGDAGARLARAYDAETLPATLHADFAAFLARYGHRGVAEIDLGLPRWSEDPGPLVALLANHLRLEDHQPPPDAHFRTMARRAAETAGELTARAARRGRWRGAAVRFFLDRGRQLIGLREMPKFLLVLLLTRARANLLAVGVGLAASGQLRRADDVFLLTLPELRAVAAGANLDARTLVRERRAEYDQELRRNHVPRLLLSDGTEPVIPHRDDLERRDVLRGTPASAGQVRGMARVVLDPAQAHLTPGDVLVAPSTDPGWTPLFLTAGGLVMEMGGAMSHGAVVAREYGIPAVVGVPGATSRIRTGQQVLVDGTAGTVSGLDGSREDTESEQLRSTESSSG